MLGDKTLLQHVIEDELQDFISGNQFTYQNVKTPLDLQDTGSFVAELNSSSKAFQLAISQDMQDRIANLTKQGTNEYRNQLGERIIKLTEGYNWTKALNIIYETYRLTKERFAGALFILETGAIVNPLHPLVSLEILSIHQPLIKSILIYTYSDLEEIYKLYGKPSKEDTKFAKENINLLMQMYQSLVKERGTKLLNNEFNLQNKQLIQNYQIGKFNGEDQRKEYYLAAHQLLTKGTFVPYYGTSLIQMGDKTSGYHLSPFKSCNLNGHTSGNPTSVCTGSTNNKTIKGLRTLHHANLGSPYEPSCMTKLSKSYADACVEQSFSVFKAAKILPKD